MLKHLIGSLLFLSALAHADVVRLQGSDPLHTLYLTVTNVSFSDVRPAPDGDYFGTANAAGYVLFGNVYAISDSFTGMQPDQPWVYSSSLGWVPLGGDLNGTHGYSSGEEITFALYQADGQTYYSNPALNADGRYHAVHVGGTDAPEPMSASLIGIGLLGLAVGMGKRRAAL